MKTVKLNNVSKKYKDKAKALKPKIKTVRGFLKDKRKNGLWKE